mmetsp:Transcript_45129/g.127768  ORF Transcript_45129/g.127768 Transcript_45129/m.127768 type:complete len:446 (-) Transcript_45129:1005-2342(-)
MEGGSVGVLAVRPGADVVPQDTEVRDAAHAQEVQAMRHVVILAPQIPGQLLAAPPAAVRVRGHGLAREDLDGTEHHREVRRARELVAIHYVRVFADVRLQVLTHPPRNEHSIGIDLQGEVVVPEASGRNHLVPDGHEELGVARGAVLRDAHGDRWDQNGLLQNAVLGDTQRVVLRGEDIVAVASEDAGVGLEVRLQHRALVAAGHVQAEAVQRRVGLGRQAPAPRAQGLTPPSCIVVVNVRLRAARLLALGPATHHLGVALVVHTQATLRLGAIGVRSFAAVGHPLANRALRVRRIVRAGGRACALGRALPRLAAWVRGLAGLASGLALAPVLALQIALAAGRRTALDPGAVRAWLRALRRGPRGRAHGASTELLARPRQPVGSRQVCPGRARRLALCEGRVLLVALSAALRAAVGLRAVLAHLRALLGAAARARAQGLALPGHR